MKNRICVKCKKSKPLNEFYFRKDNNSYRKECKDCIKNHVKNFQRINKEKIKQRRRNNRQQYPWVYILKGIKQRCRNPKATGYKYYGGKGIKCLITAEELRQLWFRDKAYLMEIPSIDRKDNDGHYTFDNCQFIEMREMLPKI